MLFNLLSSKAKSNAMEQVYKLMKDCSTQYAEFDVSVMKEFIDNNELSFDAEGNIE